MHCKEARQHIAETPRAEEESRELTQHTRQCSSCRRLLEEQMALHGAYAELRDETRTAGPSPHVEAHILAAVNSRRRKSLSRANGWPWAVVGAIAAVILAAVLMATHHRRAGLSTNQAIATPAEAPFTAMPYVVPPAPYERTTVIRTQVSLQIMQYAGFQVHDNDLGSTTNADVLYGEDGRILAIRLVPRPQDISTKRMD